MGMYIIHTAAISFLRGVSMKSYAKLRIKLKSHNGSSLLEMVCVVAISVLIGTAIIVGVDFASGFYKTTRSESEAEILSSTLKAAVTDELRYCGSLETDESGSITRLFSQSFGLIDCYREQDGRIVASGSDGLHELISPAAYSNGLTAALEVKYLEDKGRFSVKLTVFAEETEISSEFEVEPLNAAS